LTIRGSQNAPKGMEPCSMVELFAAPRDALEQACAGVDTLILASYAERDPSIEGRALPVMPGMRQWHRQSARMQRLTSSPANHAAPMRAAGASAPSLKRETLCCDSKRPPLTQAVLTPAQTSL